MSGVADPRLHLRLAARVPGQPQALATLVQHLRTHGGEEHGEDVCNRPGLPAMFLFAGPAGVGQRDTALALADLLHGGTARVVVVDLRRYRHAHGAAMLACLLAQAVQRDPRSVLLLDAVDHADAAVLALLRRVFHGGTLTDDTGMAPGLGAAIVIATAATPCHGHPDLGPLRRVLFRPRAGHVLARLAALTMNHAMPHALNHAPGHAASSCRSSKETSCSPPPCSTSKNCWSPSVLPRSAART